MMNVDRPGDFSFSSLPIQPGRVAMAAEVDAFNAAIETKGDRWPSGSLQRAIPIDPSHASKVRKAVDMPADED